MTISIYDKETGFLIYTGYVSKSYLQVLLKDDGFRIELAEIRKTA